VPVANDKSYFLPDQKQIDLLAGRSMEPFIPTLFDYSPARYFGTQFF
jgi:hypothetical protein